MNKQNKKIVVSGSIAYDYSMDFPGIFSDHILPDKIHQLNVSFSIDRLSQVNGGTGANIAYNLALLGLNPILIGVVGQGFSKYGEWLKEKQVNIDHIKQDEKTPMAVAYIMTDQKDNQISAFFPGPLDYEYCQIVREIQDIDLAIISPEVKERMLEYVKIYQELKVPYIFDPGQQITSFTAEELKIAIDGAKALIGNDYEVQLILNMLKINQAELEKMVELLVITKGDVGSEIYKEGKKVAIPPAKPENTSDPTGAGDAYRAGFIKGIISDWSLEKVGRLAGLISVYTVEKYGTQTHEFTEEELSERYKKNYQENLY